MACEPSWPLLGGQDIGIFIATGGFTSEAQREVRSQESRRISLIDLHHILDPWVEHYSKVEEEDRQRLPLRLCNSSLLE